ncbi:hypothetical protein QFW77_10915 [Luteimonas sp. RD2P54]|uniref:Uncharacterized protein n=1 Tax=Luteimonas endophytica TaxID=3042023 RepID=A0ABT6J9J2_9GAMM|nr:hypothetical protein [Luteimonas endophytica]MDH5823496.1 hypothetical protein [Luteimonas endophytica]
MPIQRLALPPWHKRQATLLYHYASLEYLKGLLSLIDEWIAFTDRLLDERSGLDATGLAHVNWKPTSTAAHFSTYAYAAMVDFRESVVRQIAKRSFERYSGAAEGQCERMLREYAGYPDSMLWMTHEQQAEFKERAEETFKYAGEITSFMQRPCNVDDGGFWERWMSKRALFPRLPRFRVRTDVEAETDKPPPRTGVYVPQEDPYAALQFAWTGGYGELGPACTFNEIGRDALAAVGREGLWGDEAGLFRFANQQEYKGIITSLGDPVEEAWEAPGAVAAASFEEKPCKWYFVEMINDEYEDHDGTYAGTGEVAEPKSRVPAGEPVPQSGFWHTPARAGSRRYFKQGDTFPKIEGSDYGATFWMWSSDQSDPKL